MKLQSSAYQEVQDDVMSLFFNTKHIVIQQLQGFYTFASPGDGCGHQNIYTVLPKPSYPNMGNAQSKMCHWLKYHGCPVDMETFKALIHLDDDSDVQG